jgi:hypothetical protein
MRVTRGDELVDETRAEVNGGVATLVLAPHVLHLVPSGGSVPYGANIFIRVLARVRRVCDIPDMAGLIMGGDGEFEYDWR